MSIFDDLLAMEEEDLQLTKDSAVKFSADEKPSEESEMEWLMKSDSNDKKKVPVKLNAWETKLKKVQTSKLIWAKCNYFKGSAAYFPGRIANINEGACEKNIPTSIKSDRELIEFFCLPKKDPAIPQYMVIMKSEICPYDSVLNGRRQLSLTQAYSREKARDDADDSDQIWDIGRMELMRQTLKTKYGSSNSCSLYSKIKQKAKEFLINATDYEGSGIFLDDASDDGDSEDSDEDNSPTPKRYIDAKLGAELFKSVSGRRGGEKLQKIVVGRWLSFQNKIYPDRTEIFRVMEVTVNPPTVKLENDSVLRARDVVCLLDKLPQGASPSSNTLMNSTSKMKNVFVAGKGGYVAGSGYSRPLEDYELERGKMKVAETIDEEMILETTERTASHSALRTPSIFENKKHTQESTSRVGNNSSSSSSSSSSSKIKSSQVTVNIDDDDDIDSVVFIDVRDQKTPSKDDYSNCNLSDDSDLPILQLIAKRKRLSSVEKEKEGKQRRAEHER